MGFFSKYFGKKNGGENNIWKDKYLNLLDAQDAAEKEFKLSQDILGKTIVRLSVIAADVDPQLEPHLQSIRDHIKKGVNYAQIKTDLDSLTAALNRVDAGNCKKQNVNGEEALLFDFLRQRYSTEKQLQAWNLLQNSYQANADTQKLFSTIAEIISDDSSRDKLENQSDQQLQYLNPSEVPAFVGTKLAQLLKKIEIPEGFADKAELLQQQLENREETDSFEFILDRVNALLIEINAKAQLKEEEIDKFLTHITKQLTELGVTVSESNIALMDASLNRSKLDESVSKQMNDLQNRSSNATQLEPLKQVISSHIEKITREIQDHKHKEAVQRENYQHQLDELGQKIKSMELETGKLQSKLITAHTNAQRDVLTDLPNRLAYEERMKMEIARWQRYHTPLCLVVWDIDFFKNFNDQYGHQVGDKVLEQVAGLFAANIRRSDFIARFGGEEFVMLLPHTNRHSAVKVAEKLRLMIAQNQFEIEDLSLSISVSCGITQFLKGDTHETAFKRADQALYRAKELGRNQCQTG